MGYIFDALNKQTGDKPKADTQPATEAVDTESAAPTTPVADALASTRAANDSETDTSPLRLADVEHAFALETPTPTTTITQAIQQETNAFDPNAYDPSTVEAPRSTNRDVAPASGQAIDKPAGGWWQRLFGKPGRGKADDRLVSMTSPASAVAEEYRSIRTSILARHDNARHLVHTITSATPQEGKTITCVNLGLSFAELRNRKTIIVECDMRLPTFGKLLTCDQNKPGLIDYLRGEAQLKDVIQQIEGSPLHIIPAGGRVSDEAVQLLSSSRMSTLIQSLRAKYDHVLIDTPPVLQLADAGILGSQSEEVLLVARMRRTPRTLVEQAVKTLSSYNALVNGIIATDNPRNRARGYGYRYGYRYGYGYGYGYTEDSRRKRRKQRKAA